MGSELGFSPNAASANPSTMKPDPSRTPTNYWSSSPGSFLIARRYAGRCAPPHRVLMSRERLRLPRDVQLVADGRGLPCRTAPALLDAEPVAFASGVQNDALPNSRKVDLAVKPTGAAHDVRSLRIRTNELNTNAGAVHGVRLD